MHISLPLLKFHPPRSTVSGWPTWILISLFLHSMFFVNIRIQEYKNSIGVTPVSNVSFSSAKFSMEKVPVKKGVTKKITKKHVKPNPIISQNSDVNAKDKDIPILLAKDLGGVEIFPSYPKRAIKFGWEGNAVVIVRLIDGIIQEVQLSQSTGYEMLDNSAISAVENWQIPKRIKDGEYWVKIPIEFQIKQD